MCTNHDAWRDGWIRSAVPDVPFKADDAAEVLAALPWLRELRLRYINWAHQGWCSLAEMLPDVRISEIDEWSPQSWMRWPCKCTSPAHMRMTIMVVSTCTRVPHGQVCPLDTSCESRWHATWAGMQADPLHSAHQNMHVPVFSCFGSSKPHVHCASSRWRQHVYTNA